MTLIEGDIRNTARLAAAMRGQDAVLHLACISNDPSFALDEDLSTSINYACFEPMVTAAQDAGVRRLVYCSTSSVYGVSDAPEVIEDHPLVPLTLYNKYKGMCEPQLFKHQAPGFTCVAIRPATICGYSPRMRLDLTVNILTNHAVNKDRITVFGGVEIVFHFAGIGDIVPSIEQPTAYMEVNVQGTVRVLEAARAAGVRKLIYAASSSCYGIADVPTREDHPIAPQYPYALSKYLGEQAAFHWHQVYGLPVNSIRIFNAYGTRSRTSGAYGAVFGVFLKQKLEGKPLTVIGDGTQRRDFVYASDVVEGFLLAAETPRTGQVWNLGTDDPQTVNRLVELLDSEIVYLPKRPGEPDCTWADTTKIRTELGWRPRISFQEGVGRMLEHIDYWRDGPLWDAESIADSTRAWFTFLSSE